MSGKTRFQVGQGLVTDYTGYGTAIFADMKSNLNILRVKNTGVVYTARLHLELFVLTVLIVIMDLNWDYDFSSFLFIWNS